ncbi:hypothetical protein QL285_058091 [Trifolium repens]|jgi:hypothetical protein|nr:hypothetical protein QL285_058091 [Trifolium repens]
MPEQETLENISEIPQGNLNVEPTHEPQTSQPKATHIPLTSEQCDAIPNVNLEHHISLFPTAIETLADDTPMSYNPSSPTSEQLIGPIYTPLTRDELVIPSDQMLALQETILMKSVDIDDSLEPPSLYPKIDIRNIQIRPLKRKRPEPKISFNRTQPFFNLISEPNLELLNIAINISLKRFKIMEEEAFIFPSDVDAAARDLEDKFVEALRLLGNYVKNKINGR